MKKFCDFHNGERNYFIQSKDPRQECSRCQSIKDKQHSSEILAKHVPVRWCEERNNCSKCCEIKFLVRVLKHYGRVCSPKKCPVCEWNRYQMQRYNTDYYNSYRAKLNVVFRLYKLLL